MFSLLLWSKVTGYCFSFGSNLLKLVDPCRTGLSVAYCILNFFYLDKVRIEKHANKHSLFMVNSYSIATFRRRETRSRAEKETDFLFSPESCTSKNLIRKKKKSFCLIGASKEHMAWHRLYTLRHQSTWQEAEATSTNYNLNC